MAREMLMPCISCPAKRHRRGDEGETAVVSRGGACTGRACMAWQMAGLRIGDVSLSIGWRGRRYHQAHPLRPNKCDDIARPWPAYRK